MHPSLDPNEKKSVLKKFSEDYRFGYRGSNKTAHKLLWISFIFLLVALVWAYIATLEEVTVAYGKVIPSKQMQLIQNLEGGIVKEILVRPGQLVEKGQIIAYLDDTRFKSDFQSDKNKEAALLVKVARLTAQIKNQPFVIPPEVGQINPDLADSERILYQTQIEQMDALKHRRDLIKTEIGMTEPLTKTGDVSRVELIRLQQSLADIDHQILAAQSANLDDLTKAKAELSTLQSDIIGAHDRLNRTTVRSPVKGIVNEVYVTTVGGVIKPGDNLIDIVPSDDTLLVEAKVRPADIGFIHPGQTATVKITAYDYSIYGGIKGVVEHISADTIKDEKQESFYQIRVRTKQNFLRGKDGKLLFIIPGMTATVDILTGHKSVLDYILKPILKTQQSALRER